MLAWWSQWPSWGSPQWQVLWETLRAEDGLTSIVSKPSAPTDSILQLQELRAATTTGVRKWGLPYLSLQMRSQPWLTLIEACETSSNGCNSIVTRPLVHRDYEIRKVLLYATESVVICDIIHNTALNKCHIHCETVFNLSPSILYLICVKFLSLLPSSRKWERSPGQMRSPLVPICSSSSWIVLLPISTGNWVSYHTLWWKKCPYAVGPQASCHPFMVFCVSTCMWVAKSEC